MGAHGGDSKIMPASSQAHVLLVIWGRQRVDFLCPLFLWQGGSSGADTEHELVRALVSTLPADYCTVIAPEERLAHAEMLHELRESGREDSASARWCLSDRQARFHVVHRNRWAVPKAGPGAVRTHELLRSHLHLASVRVSALHSSP